jgi:Flp pilus assembly protein TadB
VEYNNELIVKYLIMDIVVSILILLMLSNIMTMWYAVIIIDLVIFYMIIYFGIVYIQSKINKIHSQFPIALQCFLDEYIIYKNIKNAINTSYSKMPAEIGNVFELLTRELSGGKDYKESIYRFANELSYVWGHSFAEILTMSYEGAGDITNEMLTLNSMVSEEITAEEENKSSRFGNKMTFIILNAVAVVGFIINIFANCLARHLYFYTTTGNTLITIWLTVLIIGITIISISEKN